MGQKSALITGVNGGIGSVIARLFRDNGYHVIGTDKDPNKTQVETFLQIDLDTYARDEQYRAEFDKKIQKHGKQLEVLVNNAAVQILGPFSKLKPEQWNETINVNLNAPFLLCQCCYPLLKQNKGSIINIASIHANQTKRNFVAYATSKAALVGLTKALAVDAQGSVRVNAICPAAIDTDMLRDGFRDNEEAFELLESYHPSQSIGTAEEVARLALYIADSRNTFLNGSVVDLDGGISSVLHDPD